MNGSSFKVGGAQPRDNRYALKALTWVPFGGTTTPFSGTWVQDPFTSSDFRDAAYAIDGFGFVHLRGHVANTVGWSGTIANLPAIARPAATESFVVAVLGTASVAGAAAIQVKSTGNLDFINATGTTWTATNWVSLSGVAWVAS